MKGAYAAAIGTILGACFLLGKVAIGDWLTALCTRKRCRRSSGGCGIVRQLRVGSMALSLVKVWARVAEAPALVDPQR